MKNTTKFLLSSVALVSAIVALIHITLKPEDSLYKDQSIAVAGYIYEFDEVVARHGHVYFASDLDPPYTVIGAYLCGSEDKIVLSQASKDEVYQQLSNEEWLHHLEKGIYFEARANIDVLNRFRIEEERVFDINRELTIVETERLSPSFSPRCQPMLPPEPIQVRGTIVDSFPRTAYWLYLEWVETYEKHH